MTCLCESTASARLWLYLKRLYFISSAIAYCISPYSSFYAGLSCPYCHGLVYSSLCVHVTFMNTGHMLVKMKNVKMTLIDFDIWQRMASIRKLFSVTLSCFFFNFKCKYIGNSVSWRRNALIRLFQILKVAIEWHLRKLYFMSLTYFSRSNIKMKIFRKR